jgi:hypothetical protein
MKRVIEKPVLQRTFAAEFRPHRSRRRFSMKKNPAARFALVAVLALAASALWAQAPAPAVQSPASPYQPKFSGDPARSASEAAALAYMRVVLRAQHRFEKQYGHFATTLSELVHSGSFTKRMVNPDRGDYSVGFRGKKDSFILTLTPQHLDAEHRSFYAEDDGKIHADEQKPADADSPLVK